MLPQVFQHNNLPSVQVTESKLAEYGIFKVPRRIYENMIYLAESLGKKAAPLVKERLLKYVEEMFPGYELNQFDEVHANLPGFNNLKKIIPDISNGLFFTITPIQNETTKLLREEPDKIEQVQHRLLQSSSEKTTEQQCLCDHPSSGYSEECCPCRS